jgi:hypothetical protein
MNKAEFHEMLIEARARQDAILTNKGVEYTQGAEDRGANFKRVAEQLGVSPLVVWYIYFHKHVDALASYAKYGQIHSTEGILGRFDDAINYLYLGAMLAVENEERIAAEKNKLKEVA